MVLSKSDKQDFLKHYRLKTSSVSTLEAKEVQTPAWCSSGARLRQLNVPSVSTTSPLFTSRVRIQPLFLKQDPECMNQSVCHHLITKNCPTGIMLILRVFSTLYAGERLSVEQRSWRRIQDFFLSCFVWFCFVLLINAPLELKSFDGASLRRNVEICFASLPSPHFASSNWPVITNLKNIADVRYDHASNVPRWAGLWSKRVRPCVIPCQKDNKREIVSPCVSETAETFAASVCASVRVCVSLSHVTVQDCIQAQ